MVVRGAALISVLALAAAIGACGDDEPTTTSTISVRVQSTPEETTEPTPGSTTTSAESATPPEDATTSTTQEAEQRPESIDGVVEAVLTGSEDSSLICDQLVTDAFVRTSYGDRQGCIAAERPGALARTVRVEKVKETGATASAVSVPTGGPYDGVDVHVQLVDEGDGWRVNSLVANVPAGP